jgi:1-acyl-sn-glycerol-3-phosphate acyltransferase
MAKPARQLADVITLPTRSAGAHVAGLATTSVRTVRAWIADEVDDWGRDNGFVNRVWSFSQLRWNTSVGGAEHVPKRTGALIVINARRFALAPVFASLAIGAAVDRPVRFVGRPDLVPIGPMMQRLGALLPVEAELVGALRAGELIVMGADHELTNRQTGTIDHHLVGAAVAARVRVLPAAAVSVPTRRNARVEIGPAVRLRTKRRGPLEELETADVVQNRIDAMLDELGGTMTGTPLDWMPRGRWAVL